MGLLEKLFGKRTKGQDLPSLQHPVSRKNEAENAQGRSVQEAPTPREQTSGHEATASDRSENRPEPPQPKLADLVFSLDQIASRVKNEDDYPAVSECYGLLGALNTELVDAELDALAFQPLSVKIVSSLLRLLSVKPKLWSAHHWDGHDAPIRTMSNVVALSDRMGVSWDESAVSCAVVGLLRMINDEIAKDPQTYDLLRYNTALTLALITRHLSQPSSEAVAELTRLKKWPFDKGEHLRSLADTILKEILLSAGKLEVNARDSTGATLLMAASRFGHTDVIEILLASGADVNAKDNHGQTALMMAAGFGNADAVRILLLHGADINARAHNGTTALTTATASRHETILTMLRTATAER